MERSFTIVVDILYHVLRQERKETVAAVAAAGYGHLGIDALLTQ
jgi:hypothetical protein